MRLWWVQEGNWRIPLMGVGCWGVRRGLWGVRRALWCVRMGLFGDRWVTEVCHEGAVGCQNEAVDSRRRL